MKIQKQLLALGSLLILNAGVYAQTETTPSEVEIMKGKRVYLSGKDALTNSQSYWRVNEDKAVSGEKLSIQGVEYKKGLGVHAPSNLMFKVPSKAQYFYVVPGADDAHQGPFKMTIKVDNEEVFNSGVISSKNKKYTPKLHAIDVTGATIISLQVDALENQGGDHADWAEAFFVEGKKENKPKNPGLSAKIEAELADDELPGEKVYLTKELASTVDSYWRVMNNEGIEGGKISLKGKKFNKGVGVHAPSTLIYPVASNYKQFVVTPGANDSNAGTIRMRILIDGQEVFNSGAIKSTKQNPERLVLDVAGKKEVQLIVDEEDGEKGGDHASWASAYFLLSGGSK
ncbi:NPCBM/NEW2 domain-containing protein [Flammeovirga sp. OC4]|uniref:NPCBM/NEW2 domain-containing protein n=1 Tax=Flammeovirga sp. OC4 TaxID=1382345 RepID=UPI0005C738A5|nr:NPCBM/NEW2 domain-containing protein [Flammeovirga sp. OC4]